MTLPVFTSHFHLVPKGGMALGAFLTLFASRRLLAEFRRLIVAHEADDSVVAGVDFMDRVCRHLGARFHGFMIAQAHSAALRTQRFFLTFMATRVHLLKRALLVKNQRTKVLRTHQMRTVFHLKTRRSTRTTQNRATGQNGGGSRGKDTRESSTCTWTSPRAW